MRRRRRTLGQSLALEIALGLALLVATVARRWTGWVAWATLVMVLLAWLLTWLLAGDRRRAVLLALVAWRWRRALLGRRAQRARQGQGQDEGSMQTRGHRDFPSRR